MPKTHLASWRRYLKSPKRRYQEHKQHARSRGVPFTLTYEQWWAIWQESGKWSKRGKGRGRYCMHRIRDEGGYSLGNVYIGRQEANSYASAVNHFPNLRNRAHPDAIKEAVKDFDPECGF